jgi:hypothetical protein
MTTRMSDRIRHVAVVMQRRTLNDRWQSVIWQAQAVLPRAEPTNPSDPVTQLWMHDADCTQWLHLGLTLMLHRDEAEGYYLNVSTDTPSAFVMWRMQDDRAVPQEVTLSYNEAARWMDAGEQVDAVSLDDTLFTWVGAYVETNYRPEPKKRQRPQSFRRAQDRGGH